MKIYNYNKSTKVYTKQTNARPDPENSGEFLIPACAVIESPPVVETDEEAYFDKGWKKQKIKVPKPSEYHTWVKETGWEITSENQALFDAKIAKAKVEKADRELKQIQLASNPISSLTQSQIKDWIRDNPAETVLEHIINLLVLRT